MAEFIIDDEVASLAAAALEVLGDWEVWARRVGDGLPDLIAGIR